MDKRFAELDCGDETVPLKKREQGHFASPARDYALRMVFHEEYWRDKKRETGRRRKTHQGSLYAESALVPQA